MKHHIFIISLALSAAIFQVGCRQHDKHKRPLTYGAVQDAFLDEQHKQQVFMEHQIRENDHKSRAWRHGRRSSTSDSSGSNSDSLESESGDRSDRRRRRHKKHKHDDENYTSTSPEDRFKDFIKSHECGGSVVYNKFLSYYKTAIGDKQQPSEYSWLGDLAKSADSKGSTGSSGGSATQAP